MLENGYPNYFHGSVLPFKCTFINMSDIPDSDCLACDDTEAAMGIVAMKYAFNKDNLLAVLPKFKGALQKMPYNKATCIISKVKLYLEEYVDGNLIKELDMAFKSIGQKYGFVSAGDVRRKMVADAIADTEHKAEAKAIEEKLNTAKKMVHDGVISIENAISYFGFTKEQILG